MSQVTAQKSVDIAAAPERALAAITDYNRRAEILPPNYRDYRVVEGGQGTGTVGLVVSMWVPDALLSVSVPTFLYFLWNSGSSRWLGYRLPSASRIYNDALTWPIVFEVLAVNFIWPQAGRIVATNRANATRIEVLEEGHFLPAQPFGITNFTVEHQYHVAGHAVKHLLLCGRPVVFEVSARTDFKVHPLQNTLGRIDRTILGIPGPASRQRQ